MARSRLTYGEAIRLLVGGDDAVTVLGRVAGGALLLATPFVPDMLSLFDAKGEANNLLRDALGRAPARIRASRGRRHYELIEAAHTILVLSAFFDALAEHLGEDYAALELTDEEKEGIAGAALPAPPMPGMRLGFTENLDNIHLYYSSAAVRFADFVSGLAAGQRLLLPEPTVIAETAVEIYQERYARLSADIAEFALWASRAEHAATRAEVRRGTEALKRLDALLTATVDRASPAAETVARLARHYAETLHRPLWGASGPSGLIFPTVADGFVSPHFRVAVREQEARSRLAEEAWWERHPVRDDLDAFLAGHLAHPDSTQRPLLVLGHPGAGKSLLTEVIAARLPAEAYTAIRVPLRHVDPEAPLHRQIEAAVEDLVKEHLSWGELCRDSPTTKVLLLDGFDELVQATGVTQSYYVDRVAAFQREEWVNGRPIVVMITSRTLVMDRTVIEPGTPVLKLEPFDEEQVKRWTAAWNAANSPSPSFRTLTARELWHHRDLAGQPLLLLMLALYAAEAGVAALDGGDLSTDQLYRRLIDTFIARQVRGKAAADLGETRFRQLEVQSRRDLAAVAFAMVNRGRQWVVEADLDRDLAALHPESADRDGPRGEPVGRARRAVSSFFFVHVARADDVTLSAGRRSYEFLHATFAEYLVAEQTAALLRDLADDWTRSRDRPYGSRPDHRLLRQLLSHQPLTNGDQTVTFLLGMIHELAAPVRADLGEALIDIFRGARRTVADDDYRPTPFDVVNRAAAYTANLILLATACDPDGLEVDAVFGVDGAPGIGTTVRLWRSGLDAEAQKGYLNRLVRRDGRLLVRLTKQIRRVELREAQLVGDHFAVAVERAGRQTLDLHLNGANGPALTAAMGNLHDVVVEILTATWPVPPGSRLLPRDERRYETLLDVLAYLEDQIHPATQALLAQCLLRDLPAIASETADRVIAAALTPAAEPTDDLIGVLGLAYPDLLMRHQGLLTVAQVPFESQYLYDYAVKSGHTNDDRLSAIITALRSTVRRFAWPHARILASPTMLSTLDFVPERTGAILAELQFDGRLSWAQVRPATMLAALRRVDTVDARIRRALHNYLLVHRELGDGDAEDAEALAALHALDEDVASVPGADGRTTPRVD